MVDSAAGFPRDDPVIGGVNDDDPVPQHLNEVRRLQFPIEPPVVLVHSPSIREVSSLPQP